MKVVIVFDELDWRILNEKKYKKYNFTSNFDQLLVKSNIYEILLLMEMQQKLIF